MAAGKVKPAAAGAAAAPRSIFAGTEKVEKLMGAASTETAQLRLQIEVTPPLPWRCAALLPSLQAIALPLHILLRPSNSPL